VNVPLLLRLREARGAFVLQSDLVGDTEQNRADLDELSAFGFGLERHPYFGVAYRAPSARLCPDQIEWDLGTRLIGRRIAVWDRVASTNDLAAAASRSRANDGLVVLAEGQTAGRGRRGRAWVAPYQSSLLMSTLLFPSGAMAEPWWLMALGAVAVAEVVSFTTGREAGIKWPNDVRIEGRKVAGVLVERGAGSVVGIGLNVNSVEADFPEELRDSATSLRILAGEVVDRSDLAREVIRRLDDYYESAVADGPERLANAWRERLEPLGREVVLATREGTIRGRLVDADLTRGLRIIDNAGHETRIDHTAIQDVDPA
jgi:BirA family transcriptional regulator, biotin operon repressor / biotin---[acetyl-CoA-carboxylase] ligase